MPRHPFSSISSQSCPCRPGPMSSSGGSSAIPGGQTYACGPNWPNLAYHLFHPGASPLGWCSWEARHSSLNLSRPTCIPVFLCTPSLGHSLVVWIKSFCSDVSLNHLVYAYHFAFLMKNLGTKIYSWLLALLETLLRQGRTEFATCLREKYKSKTKGKNKT